MTHQGLLLTISRLFSKQLVQYISLKQGDKCFSENVPCLIIC